MIVRCITYLFIFSRSMIFSILLWIILLNMMGMAIIIMLLVIMLFLVPFFFRRLLLNHLRASYISNSSCIAFWHHLFTTFLFRW